MNFKVSLYSFVFLSGFIFSNNQFEQKDILDVDEAFVVDTLIQANKILVSWDIKPGYYIYKKSIFIKVGDDSLEYNYILKNESKISDEFFGESTIFKGPLKVDVELSDVNLNKLNSLKIIYQGCAEGKYCYPKRVKSL
jgi:thiol:disulfide interchange protein DsbD